MYLFLRKVIDRSVNQFCLTNVIPGADAGAVPAASEPPGPTALAAEPPGAPLS